MTTVQQTRLLELTGQGGAGNPQRTSVTLARPTRRALLEGTRPEAVDRQDFNHRGLRQIHQGDAGLDIYIRSRFYDGRQVTRLTVLFIPS